MARGMWPRPAATTASAGRVGSRLDRSVRATWQPCAQDPAARSQDPGPYRASQRRRDGSVHPPRRPGVPSPWRPARTPTASCTISPSNSPRAAAFADWTSPPPGRKAPNRAGRDQLSACSRKPAGDPLKSAGRPLESGANRGTLLDVAEAAPRHVAEPRRLGRPIGPGHVAAVPLDRRPIPTTADGPRRRSAKALVLLVFVHGRIGDLPGRLK